MGYFFLIFGYCLIFSLSAFSKTVHYDLTINNESLNVSGKIGVDFALTVNGTIPAPTLEFTEGDDAEITVRNNLKKSNEDVSLHWHGLLVPAEEDGVPYINTPPILPGESRTFRFKIRQNGTYWYHSHTMLQEQKGVYGAIIIHPRQEKIKSDHEYVAVLSDWSDESPEQILNHLKKDGDYYQFKKGTIRSYFSAITSGKLSNFVSNEWDRMGGMDYSDVGYDAFLLNGKPAYEFGPANPGEKIRIRIINAASSTYFRVSLGQKTFRVVAADGIEIEPIDANELFMGMAETYDIVFTVPTANKFELRATAQDGSGYASGYVGSGPLVAAKTIPVPDLYGPMQHQHHGHQHQPDDGLLTVDKLKSITKNLIPRNSKKHELKLKLNGDMRRYIWYINGKTISEDRMIYIGAGEVVRITYENESMMHHPMHLHGHFFRVLNEAGDYSPWKHTVDIPPMARRTIEFEAQESGQWMLHCHNLYHMDSGMARVVRYKEFKESPEMAHIAHQDHHLHDSWYKKANFEIATNYMSGNFKISQSWNEISIRAEGQNENRKGFNLHFLDKWNYEGDLFYRRWIQNWISFVAGATNYSHSFYGIAGMTYFFPLMVEASVYLNHEGRMRIDAERKFQWTKYLFSTLAIIWRPGAGNMVHPLDLKIALLFSPAWEWAVGVNYSNESFGVGFHIQL